MNRPNNMFSRVISLVLVLALFLSVCPVGVHAQEIAKSVPIVIVDETYYVDFRFIGDTLYCPADQWAQVADCLWKFNPDQKKVYIYDHYGDSLAIYTDFDDQEYFMDGSVSWIPFFEAAKHSGVFFSAVENDAVHGYRAKPLAEFYKDMDRMFRVSRYRISSLINSLGSAWMVASSAARSYAILSTMSIEGFLDAATGKMDQEIYDDIFIELLKTDDSLLGTFVDLGKEISRPGEVISLLQKSLDEDGVVTEVLQEMGFSESEIREIVWVLAQDAYGDKTLNDLADYYEAVKLTDIFKILKIVDDMATTVDADAHTIMAMQEVFSGSDNAQIRSAMSRAVELRLGSKALAVGNYSFEYLDDVLSDIVIEELEDSIEEGWDVANWEKLGAKILVWIYDEALSLTDKADAIMYAEASSLIQLELADYYYEHCNDGAEDTGLVMHSVALLYLRSCLASWKKFGFDGALSDAIDNASRMLSGEISNLMEYTETELRQSGTSDECKQAITELVRRKLTTVVPEPSVPVENNSHLYQDAMAAYAQLLQNGVMLCTDSGDYVAASHYQLLDMDRDGVPELVAFAVEDYISLFQVYTYRDGYVQQIGDSLYTCDVSQWYNASHDLYICDGNRLYAGVDKSTVAYTSGVRGFLEYDGRDMRYAEGGLDGAVITEKLIDNSTIVGGIQIGSESDALAKLDEPEGEPEESPEPPPQEGEETVPPENEPVGPSPREVTAAIMSHTDCIAAGGRHSVVLMPDGTAVATGANSYGQCNVWGWNNLVAVSTGDYFTVGLRQDGSVVATGDNQYGQCDVAGWSGIISIVAGDFHTVGLREDGTVVAVGDNRYGQCNVSVLNSGKEIIAVAASWDHTAVLYADGTAAAVGDNHYGECDVDRWQNLVAIYAGANFTVGLRADGTVVATGNNAEGQCNVGGWADVVMLSAGDYHTVAVTDKGQILSTGSNTYGQQNFMDWYDIIAIGAGCQHTVVITAEGSIYAVGRNYEGQCDIFKYSFAKPDAPETEFGGESSVQYDRPADGTYYYSMAQFGCYDSEAFYVRLRGPMEDYQTFLRSDFPSGPIGISFEHNAGYEVYRVEYCMAYTYGDDGEYVIYTCSMDDSETSYRYDIEESGYVSVSDDSGNLGTGYGLKLCWFAQNQLEIADDCVFADDRRINSPNRIEMSLDAFMDTVDEECVYVWSYVEVHVTIRGGKVVELVLPYIP